MAKSVALKCAIATGMTLNLLYSMAPHFPLVQRQGRPWIS